MKANEVNEVINNICKKIGIGIDNVKDFVPMFAKYKILNSALLLLGFLVVGAIFLIITRQVIRKYKTMEDYWDKDNYMFAIGATSLVSLVCGFGFLFNLFTMIEWIIVPEAMMVRYILSLM